MSEMHILGTQSLELLAGQAVVLNIFDPSLDLSLVAGHILEDTMRAGDYTAESWKEVSANRKQSQATLTSLGRLVSLTLVDRSEESGKRCYRYRVEFEKNTVLQLFVFDEQSKVTLCRTEDIR